MPPVSAIMTPRTLTIIRVAMLAGVLFFGGIAWFVGSSRAGTSGPEGAVPVLQYAFLGLVLLAAGGTVVIRSVLARTEGFEGQARLCIVGYALAEGSALLGAVYLFLTGDPLLYLAGLILFAVAAVFLSPRTDATEA